MSVRLARHYKAILLSSDNEVSSASSAKGVSRQAREIVRAARAPQHSGAHRQHPIRDARLCDLGEARPPPPADTRGVRRRPQSGLLCRCASTHKSNGWYHIQQGRPAGPSERGLQRPCLKR